MMLYLFTAQKIIQSITEAFISICLYLCFYILLLCFYLYIFTQEIEVFRLFTVAFLLFLAFAEGSNPELYKPKIK